MADALTIALRQMRAEDTAAVARLTTQLGYPATEDEIRRRYDLIKDRWDARIFVAQHDLDKAAASYRATLLLQPADVDARIQLASVLIE